MIARGALILTATLALSVAAHALEMRDARPRSIVDGERIAALADVDGWDRLRERARTARGGMPEDPTQLALWIVNQGLMWRRDGDAAAGREGERLLQLCLRYLHEQRHRHGDIGVLDEFETLFMLQNCAIARDLFRDRIDGRLRDRSRDALRRWGDFLGDTVVRRDGWAATNIGNHKHAVLASIALIAAGLDTGDATGTRLLTLADRLFAEELAPMLELVADGGWPEGIAYNRVAATELVKLVDCLGYATGDDYWTRLPLLAGNADYMLSQLAPHGRWLPIGDVWDDRPHWGDRLLLRRYATRLGHAGAAALAAHLETLPAYQDEADALGLALAWGTPQPAARDLADLPRAASFPGSGVHTWRSDWRDDALQVAFTAGPLLSSHQHADQGALVVNWHGPVLLDTGLYDGFWTRHSFHYYRRSVAHNTLVVRDQRERFQITNDIARLQRTGIAPVANDGGQRYFNLVPHDRAEYERYRDVLTSATGHLHASGPDFAYFGGDLGGTYHPDKLTTFQREAVVLGPRDGRARIVVRDRVTLPEDRSDLEAAFLWHSAARPDQRDALLHVAAGPVRCRIVPLFAHDRRVVGGPDRAYLVDGTQVPPEKAPPAGAPPTGAWRVEILPTIAPGEPFTGITTLVLTAGEADPGRPTTIAPGAVHDPIAGDWIVWPAEDHAVPLAVTPGAALTVTDCGDGTRHERTADVAGGLDRRSLTGTGPWWIRPYTEDEP